MNRHDIAIDSLISHAQTEAGDVALWLSGDEPWVEGYVGFGIPSNSDAVKNRDDLTNVSEWLEQPILCEGSGVLLDNTTIVTLTSLLAGEGLSPLTLWDLGRAVTALITYDNVFHFQHPDVNDNSLNALLGQEVFRPLRLPFDVRLPFDATGVTGVPGLFIDAWHATHSLMRGLESAVGTPTVEGLEIEDLAKQWSLAIGRSLEPADVVNSKLSDHEWYSPAAALLGQLWRTTGGYRIDDPPGRILDGLKSLGDRVKERGLPDSDGILKSTIRQGNYRGYVNERLAGYLSLPYMPNMARIPFRSRFYDRPRVITDRLPSILELNNRYAERAAQVKILSGTRFFLPVFLALAVREAAAPQDVWAAVANLREQARRFRKRRADLDRALDQGDEDAIKKIDKAINTEATKLTKLLSRGAQAGGGAFVSSVEANATTVVSQFPLGLLQPALSAVIAGASKLLPESVTHRLLWRLCRPELRFLSDIASQSRAITNAMPAIQRLWGLPDSRINAFRSRYDSFADWQGPLRP